MSEPCVIARLAGGLGNQLFMYAFNRAMAERNGVPLKLDVRGGFINDRTYKRTHLLDLILPPVPPASRWESRLFPLGHTLRKLDRKFNARLPLERRYYVQERTMSFDAEIRDLKIVRPTVFNGYWQAPQYFDDLNPGMAELIRFPEQLTAPLADELAAIRAAQSPICLAIRRYEEVPRPKHHILQLDYFQQAMARIEQEVERPHYFVFAQNMDWARANIKSEHPITFAREKDLHAGVIQDLYLMTQCRHFILSNSSLHWWAAWLNKNQDKTVVAPAKGWPNADMPPADWVRLP
ncbi:MAG: alpha-1,2-fucosyltransferase [Pseudomonadota bacterium]